MIAPVFATGCEIKTLTAAGEPAQLVILRFFWNEGKNEKGQNIMVPVATILFSRKEAKGFMKQFYSVMSAEDEYPKGPKSV